MTPRAAFIYGYYVSKVESLAATLTILEAEAVADIRAKILAAAGELWDLLHADEVQS